MSGDFASASRVELVGGGRFRTVVPDGWQQGQGAFGGLVLATLLRAMQAAEQDSTRLARTLAGDLCGPVQPGEAEIQVRVLRRGKHQTNLAAELLQGGQVQALATTVLSSPRPVEASRVQPPAPALGPWTEIAPVPLGHGVGPVFAAHYEYRSGGPPLFGGGGEGATAGYIRESRPLARLDAPAVIGRLDAWWPTLSSIEAAPRAVVTISFVAELLRDVRAWDTAEPFQLRGRLLALEDGHFVELRELWSPEGLVAANQQTFAILR
jgi:acyl-CoA thioesterase superfamily protein